MRLPRMTTRRWMVAVVVATVFVRAAHAAERYYRLRCRQVALRGYRAAMFWYDEGRMTVTRSVVASERLLEAELALSPNHEAQVAAVSAHLERASVLIERERNEPLMLCNDNREMWIGDAEATLAKWRARLEMTGGMRRIPIAVKPESLSRLVIPSRRIGLCGCPG
jgi:hypothetical protein